MTYFRHLIFLAIQVNLMFIILLGNGCKKDVGKPKEPETVSKEPKTIISSQFFTITQQDWVYTSVSSCTAISTTTCITAQNFDKVVVSAYVTSFFGNIQVPAVFDNIEIYYLYSAGTITWYFRTIDGKSITDSKISSIGFKISVVWQQ